MTNSRHVSFRFKDEFLYRMRKRAKELNLTLSDYIRELVRNDLESRNIDFNYEQFEDLVYELKMI